MYPVRVWRDAERGVSRMDTFGGRNVLISTKVTLHEAILVGLYIWHLTSAQGSCHLQDLEIEIIPRLDQLVCRLNEPDEDDVNLLQAPVGCSLLLPCLRWDPVHNVVLTVQDRGPSVQGTSMLWCGLTIQGGCLCRSFPMCLSGSSMEPMRCAASRQTCGCMSRGKESRSSCAVLLYLAQAEPVMWEMGSMQHQPLRTWAVAKRQCCTS